MDLDIISYTYGNGRLLGERAMRATACLKMEAQDVFLLLQLRMYFICSAIAYVRYTSVVCSSWNDSRDWHQRLPMKSVSRWGLSLLEW